MFTEVFEAKEEPERNYDIIYRIDRIDEKYYIESEICGGKDLTKAYIGDLCERKAVRTAELLARNSVRPVHIKDIIEDILF